MIKMQHNQEHRLFVAQLILLYFCVMKCFFFVRPSSAVAFWLAQYSTAPPHAIYVNTCPIPVCPLPLLPPVTQDILNDVLHDPGGMAYRNWYYYVCVCMPLMCTGK